MGCPEGRAILNGFIPNGLLPDEATSVNRVLDHDRWARVEERTADLITHIQPNQPSEGCRNAIASYVQRLITKCFSCQVFTFGSVPLKTYLPDGDIDLTAFSNNQNFKESWVRDVRDILESEERSEDAEFRVKEVQHIQAEVKIIKCLVENIVVDISFNQLGGLCTLCFLEEVDNLISQNHLFKRSIILIKAWCYYESRILGAHHGLISTYALETLVLYIFHVYNNTFSGPLEVLYRFLEFFSRFDWDNYCLSLWGPVPISSLPDTRAEPPRKDCGELLLSKYFLDACSSVYTVMPSSQDNREQPFVSKYFNIIDPLRANNNLGRSVSKGNFFRIRSAFAFGAQRLLRLLDCPDGNLITEFDLFFKNTWDRHGKGHRPDAPNFDICARYKKVVENQTCHESEDEGSQVASASHGKVSNQMFGTFDTAAVSHVESPKTNGILANAMAPDLKSTSSKRSTYTDRGQSPKYLSNEVHAMRYFTRTHSSPEFAHVSGEVPPQHRYIGPLETERRQSHSSSSMSDNSKRLSLRSKVSDNHSVRASARKQHSLRKTSSYWRSDNANDSKNTSNNYNGEFGLGVIKRDGLSVEKVMQMHQEEQDFINMTANYRNHTVNGYLPAPMGSNSTNMPFPVLPPFMTSGYAHVSSFGMIPANIPSTDYFWGHNVPYSQGVVSFPASESIPSEGATSNPDEITEAVDGNLVVAEFDNEDGDGGFWSEQDATYVGGHDYEDGSSQSQQLRERKAFGSVSSISGNSSYQTSSGSYSPKDYGESIENALLIRESHGDDPPDGVTIKGNVKSTSKSFTPSCATSTTKLASSNFSNGSTLDESKLNRDQMELKTDYPTQPSALHLRQYESPVDQIFFQQDDDSGDWIHQPTVGTDLAESTSAEAVTPDVRAHQSLSHGQGSMIVSNSSVPVTPVFVSHGSRQRPIDDRGLLPVIFYPTGPPVPFLIMLPLDNLPAATGTSYTDTNFIDSNTELGNHHAAQSNVSLDNTENLESSNSCYKPNHTRHDTTVDPFENQKVDILNGDFVSHWQNLLYGRFCQNAELQGLMPYFPSALPPMYFQPEGQFSWDSSGRPATNMNLTHPHFIPMMPIHCHSDSSVGVSQHFTDMAPVFHGGTGTYLPNPKFVRNRHYLNTRNHRGSYLRDRKDHHGEREGDWSYNS